MESKKSPHHKEDVKFHSGSIGEGFTVIRSLLRVAPIFKKLQLRVQKELGALEYM